MHASSERHASVCTFSCIWLAFHEEAVRDIQQIIITSNYLRERKGEGRMDMGMRTDFSMGTLLCCLIFFFNKWFLPLFCLWVSYVPPLFHIPSTATSTSGLISPYQSSPIWANPLVPTSLFSTFWLCSFWNTNISYYPALESCALVKSPKDLKFSE